MKKTRALILLAGVVLLAGCSTISTRPDEAGLHYSGGTGSDIEFKDCIGPGKKEYFGPGDNNYKYPLGDRTYEFKDAEGAERGPISVTDEAGNELLFQGVLSFRLNTDCETLRKFHDAIGLKYGASADGVEQWGELLDVYLGSTLESAMNDSGNSYTWQNLYADAAKRAEFVEDVKKNLPDYVEGLAKGAYFEDFTLTVQRPSLDQRLKDQIADQAEAQERVNTAGREAEALGAEQAQIEKLVQIFGGWEGYIAYRNQIACENGGTCIPFVPIPSGSGINITPGG